MSGYQQRVKANSHNHIKHTRSLLKMLWKNAKRSWNAVRSGDMGYRETV